MKEKFDDNRQLFYSTKYNDIPFIEVNNGLKLFKKSFEKSVFNVEYSDNGDILVCTINNNAKVKFNYNEQYIKFNDYDSFATNKNNKGLELLDGYVSEATSDEPVFMLRSAYDHYYRSDPLTINLDDYSISMLKNNGSYYRMFDRDYVTNIVSEQFRH